MRKPLKPRHSIRSNQGPEDTPPIILLITPGPLNFVFPLPRSLQCILNNTSTMDTGAGRGMLGVSEFCLGRLAEERWGGRGTLFDLNKSLGSQLWKQIFRVFAFLLCPRLPRK